MRAAEIHAALGAQWPVVLAQLGIDDAFLQRKAGPCPACGGRDRFTFDNRKGRGDFFCRHCGPGSGFELLMRVHRWSFSEARKRVLEAAGIAFERAEPMQVAATAVAHEPEIAQPTSRVRSIIRSTCAVADCADAVAYLESRRLWPLPVACTLRAHASAEYWEDGRSLGRYPALVAAVHDIEGELVTAHVTYLANGRKLEQHTPRKILSPMTGRRGCAVRLLPLSGAVLGIAEGLETALSAHALHGVPAWAALNTALLQKFEPPEEVGRLMIFADRDAPGLEAAARLMERLQGRVELEIAVPPSPFKDWNEVPARGDS